LLLTLSLGLEVEHAGPAVRGERQGLGDLLLETADAGSRDAVSAQGQPHPRERLEVCLRVAHSLRLLLHLLPVPFEHVGYTFPLLPSSSRRDGLRRLTTALIVRAVRQRPLDREPGSVVVDEFDRMAERLSIAMAPFLSDGLRDAEVVCPAEVGMRPCGCVRGLAGLQRA
jgi:hypothetical protein